MGLKSWFKSRKKIVEENEALRREMKEANLAASRYKMLLDQATLELRQSLDQMVRNFAMITLERNVLRTERNNALTELAELKQALRPSTSGKN